MYNNENNSIVFFFFVLFQLLTEHYEDFISVIIDHQQLES